MELDNDNSKTLFDPEYSGFPEHVPPPGYPYSLTIQGLEAESRFPEDELVIFQQVLEHEVPLYEPRGAIAGSLRIAVGSGCELDIDTLDTPFRIPDWIEADALALNACSAAGILLIESEWLFRALCDARAWSTLDLLLATGCGVPRLAMRRLLHRISTAFNIPVFVLCDNDTWGYFIFSLLERGLLAPHTYCKYVSIRDLRYLGLCVDDISSLCVPADLRRCWDPHWSLRLKYMRDYECFSSPRWQEELGRFEMQQSACDARSVCQHMGVEEFVSNYLARKLRTKAWIGPDSGR